MKKSSQIKFNYVVLSLTFFFFFLFDGKHMFEFKKKNLRPIEKKKRKKNLSYTIYRYILKF